MAQSTEAVRVALDGQVITMDASAQDPKNFDDLKALLSSGQAEDLGFTTEDGVSFSFSKDVEDIMGWQSSSPLRKLVTAAPKGCEFTLRQVNRATWVNSLGGSVEALSNGLYMWEPDDTTIPTKKLVITFEDGEYKYMFVFRKAQNTAEAEFSLVRNDAINLPNNWSAIAVGRDSNGDIVKEMYMITNDPAFAGTPSANVANWAATTAYAQGDDVKLPSGETLNADVAGTSGSSAPTAPASVGGTVVDGTVTWSRTA